MKKKFLAVALLLMCSLGSLTACGDEDTDGLTKEEVKELEEGLSAEDKAELEEMRKELMESN